MSLGVVLRPRRVMWGTHAGQQHIRQNIEDEALVYGGPFKRSGISNPGAPNSPK